MISIALMESEVKQMTIAEAIRILEQSCPKRPQKLWSIKRKEAVKMAIEALQRGLENVNADSCSESQNRSDLISRTRLLTDLQETVEAWSKYPVMEEEIKGIEVAIAYVKNIPSAQPEQRWIPSGEKPPEKGSYLVWMPFAPPKHRITVAEYCGGYWNIKTPISAWMPLPGPYQEGEQNE